MPHKSITLFYPMYNEIGHIASMTTRALDALESLNVDFEILIIDDGSIDGSEKVADEFARNAPRIRVIHHDGNKGYGQALRTGFASASKEIVAYTDCDEPVDLNILTEVLPLLTQYDMVIGYRSNRHDGWLRFVYSKGYNTLVRLLFGVRVHDINFSFKLIRRESLRKLCLSAGSVFIDGELLAEANRNKLTIHEIPVQYQVRRYGRSNFNSLRAVTSTLQEIWAYYKRRHGLLNNHDLTEVIE
ncbi:MAG: glycosyltransferase family 2 protein [Aggregatilineales bacterium]